MKNENDLIRVFSGTEITVNLLKDELESVGISAMIQNDFQSGITAGFFGGGTSAVDLFIQEIDEKKALPIIDEFLKNNKSL
jgi:hypothetical protein